MNRTLFTSILALSIAGTAAVAQQTLTSPQPGSQNDAPAAQHERHHAPNPHKMAMHLSKKLGLSADQTAKLEPILADRQQKVQALRADTSLTPDQRKQQMRAIGKDSQEQLAGILTPEQMQQLKAMHHGRRGDRQAPPPTGI
jgi:periplasmic protein CpxP/Spy